MQSRLKLKPGRKDAVKPVELSRPRPAGVRYRSDEEAWKRYQMVELIVEESSDSSFQPNISPVTIIDIRLGMQEIAQRREVKLPWRQVEPRDRSEAGGSNRIVKERSIRRWFEKLPA